jgi:hypothetical protein
MTTDVSSDVKCHTVVLLTLLFKLIKTHGVQTSGM